MVPTGARRATGLHEESANYVTLVLIFGHSSILELFFGACVRGAAVTGTRRGQLMLILQIAILTLITEYSLSHGRLVSSGVNEAS